MAKEARSPLCPQDVSAPRLVEGRGGRDEVGRGVGGGGEREGSREERERKSARGKGGANAAHVPVPPRPGWQNCFSQFNKLNINASVLSSVPSAALSNLRSCYVKWAILVAFGLKPHFKYRFHSSRNGKGGRGKSMLLYWRGFCSLCWKMLRHSSVKNGPFFFQSNRSGFSSNSD